MGAALAFLHSAGLFRSTMISQTQSETTEMNLHLSFLAFCNTVFLAPTSPSPLRT